LPFTGRSLFEVASAILGEDPPDPRTLREEVPPQLSTAVLSALAKDPRRRPPTATAFAHLLSVATRPS
jgi:serine/threonine-protein kinase